MRAVVGPFSHVAHFPAGWSGRLTLNFQYETRRSALHQVTACISTTCVETASYYISSKTKEQVYLLVRQGLAMLERGIDPMPL